jgi:alanyl-tRNA synthetase
MDPTYEEGTPLELIEKGSDRMVELWNLVFMQYVQDEKGILHLLPSPSIDTGMGLERMAAALQGKTSNFETDLFKPLIAEICGLASREYPAHDELDVSVRLIADHARAIAFLIGDGIMPANDGRGYVLRRLVRRAFRHGNLLGIDRPFVYKLVGVVSDIVKDAYPELLSSLNFMAKICRAEEERFAQTLASGLRYFHYYVKEAKGSGRKTLGGEAAFKLYDTFGFPLDLSQELAEEERLTVDEEGFRRELGKQKERARLSWRGHVDRKEQKAYEKIKWSGVRFAGYGQERVPEAGVIALFKDGAPVSELCAGDEGEAVLDVTPFYAEAGGQVGDTGSWKNPHFSAVVTDTFYPVPEIISHKIKVLSGIIKKGDKVEVAIDAQRRKAVRDNHTATHLLHASLRQVLGDHIKQAGSLVSVNRLRFDFTHFQALTGEEIRTIETLVNKKIRENIPVHIKETTLEEGTREGATAIFEEKYGEKVRMVAVGDFSKELCGGTHAPSTGEIGLFKIIEETSVAAGLRRIEALTGEEALSYIQETEGLVGEALLALHTSRKDLVAQIEKLKELVKEKEHEMKLLRQKMLQGTIEKPGEEMKTVKGVSVLVRKMEGLNAGEARSLADNFKQKIKSGVVVLGSAEEGKVFLVVGVTKDLTSRVSAAEIIKPIASIVGGGGGGRPDFAQAGGTKIEELDKALEESLAIIEKFL